MGMNQDDLDKIDDLIFLRIEKYLSTLFTAMPCSVTEYDAGTQKVTVKPLVKMNVKFKTDEQELPSISDVPVGFMNCDNRSARLTFPIKTDDVGIVIFSSLSLDNYLSSKTTEAVDSESYDRNSLKDAMFIPMITSFERAIDSPHATAVELKYDKAKFRTNKAGKFALQGETYEAMERISTALDKVITALGNVSDGLGQAVSGLTQTAAGTIAPGPGTPVTLSTSVVIDNAASGINTAKSNLDTTKSQLQTVKNNFDELKE